MADKIKCTIVSGAPNECSGFLKENIDKESFIIAADSGYLHLQKAGLIPDLIIADFDSSEAPDIDCEIIKYPIKKDDTDTFNCVKYAVEKGFEKIEIFNAVGSRFDHTYANVLCLDYCRKNGVKCSIIDGHNRLTLITDKHTFKADYKFFSLFSFLTDCKGVTITGAEYTPERYNKTALDIAQGDQFAVCNSVKENECTVTVKEGVLLLAESNDQ